MRVEPIIHLALLCCLAAPAGRVSAAPTAKVSAAPGPFAPGKVIDSVTCKADPTQSYALYIPIRGDNAALPAVYLFDSHGVGALPLRKYRELADAYGFILIGSNNSKNGNDWATTQTIWRRMWEDTHQRLKINGARIYTAGFSGGAKVASYVAIEHPEVKGVVVNGAGLPDGVSANSFPFSLTLIAGEGDMNMTDLVALDRQMDGTKTRHRILFFDGKHEWAPVGTMRTAFIAWQLDAMEAKLIPRDHAFIDGWITKSRERVQAYSQENQLIKARQECRLSLNMLGGLADAAWFRQKAASLDGDVRYRQQLQQQESLLVTEQDTKTEYMQHFQDEDVSYWKRTIDGLRIKAGARTAESAMYQRLLAYLSLAFYSISNQMINSGQDGAARHFTELYKMADPTNSEAWYFSAILHVREGDAHAAETDLLTAVRDGFNDKRRLQQQPEFQHARIDIAGIERKMHG